MCVRQEETRNQKKLLQVRRDEVAEKERQLAKNHQELDALNDTLRQVSQRAG